MPKQIKKIVIIGPESTGKSTLSAVLGDHYKEPWVPEFAREYLNTLNRNYQYEDLVEIAKGQLRAEDSLSEATKDLLFCDTDLHVIKVWSDHKYGKTDPWILAELAKRKYDLYLLTDIDIPWQADKLREHPSPQMRTHFLKLYRQVISETGVPFTVISGDLEERTQSAISAVKKLMSYP
jgi:NadR type nicotinamide-nucleotide adenylyltransferase